MKIEYTRIARKTAFSSAIVLLATVSAYGGRHSGFAISDKYVLTAFSAVGHAESVSVKFGDNDWTSAAFVEGSAKGNWCVLQLSERAPSVVKIETHSELGPGDKVYEFGFHDAAGEIGFLDGSVVGVMKNDFGNQFIRHSIEFEPGTLGAPLFSEDGNCVVGIVDTDAKENGRIHHRAVLLSECLPRIGKYVSSREKGTRKSNRNAVCVIQGIDVDESESANETRNPSRKVDRRKRGNDANSKTYQKCRNSVATVEGTEGAGTGFLCEMDGKKFFVTNKHVARQRGQLTAYFLDGEDFKFSLDSTIEVAENRDLVRFEVKTEKPCLKLSPSVPDIGEQVEFYGNAGGGKVITVTAAEIMAVGQERIEIDSPIQGGNSGSPLVRIVDGCVVGVTTLSTFNRLSGDASQVGTRYDPDVKLTREFAVRFAGVKWRTCEYGTFLKEINVYRDLGVFYGFMKKICFGRSTIMTRECDLPDIKFTGVTMLNEQVKRMAKIDEEVKKLFDRWDAMRERNRLGGMIRHGDTEFDTTYKRLKASATKMYRTRKEVLEKVISYVRYCKVLPKAEKEDAAESFDYMYRMYCEKFKLQMNGIFPKVSE